MGLKLATLVYVRRGEYTLMLRKARGFQQGKWNGLGGKFAPGESPEACMRREVLEESGLHVSEAALKGFITFPNFDAQDDWYTFVYLVTAFSGEPRASDEGELHWVKTAQLSELNLYDGDRIFLPWLERPEVFSAVFRYGTGSVFEGYEVTFY